MAEPEIPQAKLPDPTVLPLKRTFLEKGLVPAGMGGIVIAAILSVLAGNGVIAYLGPQPEIVVTAVAMGAFMVYAHFAGKSAAERSKQIVQTAKAIAQESYEIGLYMPVPGETSAKTTTEIETVTRPKPPAR